MAFVATATFVGGAVGLSGLAATIGGGALIGAGVGGLYSAVTGDGDILNSMLTGGLIGGLGGGIGGAMFPGAAGITPAATTVAGAGATGAGTVGPAATTVATTTPAMEAAALLDAAAVAEGGAQAGMATQYAAQEAAKNEAAKVAAKALTGKEMLGYGLAGTSAMQLLGGRGKGAQAPASATDPGMIRPYEFTPNQMAQGSEYPSPYVTAKYDAAGMPIMDTRERNYFDQKYTALTPYSAKTGTVNPNVPVAAARGGIMQSYQSGGPVERMSMMNTAMNPQGGLYPQGMIDKTQYAAPTQRPVSSELVMDTPAYERSNPMLMAKGGIAQFAKGGLSEFIEILNASKMAQGGAADLGDYSDGGRLLKGPGDGVSDDIPATIAGKQPARLADGEFVIPARIVSEIGNGSTDAGAKRLYAMMDRIQDGRKKTIGKKNIAKDTKAKKHLLA
jgi:hypothetical protein